MTNDELVKKCKEKFSSISGMVISDDRAEAVKHFGKNYWTIHRYVNGEVKNLEFGVKLYEFLNARIEARKAALN